VALGFIPSDASLLVLQATVVAAPRSPPRPSWISRLGGPVWAVIPIASIVGVVFAIRFVSDTADALTYLALVAVPPLAAAAVAWAARPERPITAGRVIGAVVWTAALFATATGHGLLSQGAASLLSALSCVTLGVLLAAVAPPRWLKLGILAMAAADVWLVASDILQHPNSLLVQAQPGVFLGAQLPRLQSEVFGGVSMGFGDLFIAALLGAVLASSGRPQWPAALLTLTFAALFDLLFLAVSELPATVPVAATLIVLELSQRAPLSRVRLRRGRRWASRDPVSRRA
jgi:hypothetical protein